MLQGRLFSYNDTHRHRLGANWDQIPVNCPFRANPRNYQRDGMDICTIQLSSDGVSVPAILEDPQGVTLLSFW